jgi:uncharacterized membrane-anchored protein
LSPPSNQEAKLAHAVEHYASKVPEVTLEFWVIKILATTLGETGGDTVTMTMDLGYLTGTAIFLSVLVVLVLVQIAAKKFHPLLYWSVIVASTTAGTTLADFATRSLGIGYMGGSLLLFGCLMAVLALWYGRRAPSRWRRSTRPRRKLSTGRRSPSRRPWGPRSAIGPPMPALDMAERRWFSPPDWRC